MERLRILGTALAIVTLCIPGAEAADQQKIAPGCEKIVAVLDAGGGNLSADEVAKRTSTDVETVRNCTDQWRATMKDKAAPKAAPAARKIAPGCEKIVAVLDAGGGNLSADEVAKRTSTDVETVRSCTDQWRKTMPQ